MTSLEIGIVLLLAILAIVRVAGALRVPPAIVLLVGGLGLSFVPQLGNVELAPDTIFTLFLPPLLFVASVQTSWRDFGRNVRSISLLALGLVVLTTLVVGWIAHWAVPGLGWAAAFTLGAIVSPTDAVAATSITQSLGVPRRTLTILEGESLANDATGLVIYKLAVAATLTGAFSLAHAGWEFLLISGGGIALGLVAGWIFIKTIERLDEANVENALALTLPFATYIVADVLLHISGVLAVVAAGFVFSRRLPRAVSSGTRLQATGFWTMLDFLFNNALFLLVGLQLPRIVKGLGALSLAQASLYALIVTATLVVTRMAWVFAVTFLPRVLGFGRGKDDPFPSWKPVFIVAWTGMRGAISLAGALALPFVLASGAPFPQRNLIIFITFFVILATLVLQGLTLPPLIRALHLTGDGETEREEQRARLSLARAALSRIDEIENHDASSPLLEHFRSMYLYRADALAASDSPNGPDQNRDETGRNKRQLALELVSAQRQALAALRKRGDLHEDAVRRIQTDLDLEEQRLQPGESQSAELG